MKLETQKTVVNEKIRPTGRAGFSIIELVIVITLIGIVGAILFPQVKLLLARQRLSAAANEIVSTLSGIRMKSISQKSKYEVVIENSKQYKIYRDLNKNGTFEPNELVETKDITVEYPDVSLAAEIEVIFYPMGTTNSASVNVSNPIGGERIITLNFTGAISVEKI